MLLTGLVLATFIVLEQLYPRTPIKFDRSNLFWLAINLFALHFVISNLIPEFQAFLASAQVSVILEISSRPMLVQLLVFLLIQDFLSYCTHWSIHHFNLTWKFHSVHHSSTQLNVFSSYKHTWLDVTPMILFSCVLSMIVKVQPVVVVWVNFIFNAACLWQHSNINFKFINATWLQKVFITPSNHRIHHKLLDHAHHSNLGFLFTIWDRIFGTYSAELDSVDNFGINIERYPYSSNLRQFFYPFLHESYKSKAKTLKQ